MAINVYKVDLDVDTDNNGSINDEDEVPSKIIQLQKGCDDPFNPSNPDDVERLEDKWNDFAELQIENSGPKDRTEVKFKIYFDESKVRVYQLQSGHISGMFYKELSNGDII